MLFPQQRQQQIQKAKLFKLVSERIYEKDHLFSSLSNLNESTLKSVFNSHKIETILTSDGKKDVQIREDNYVYKKSKTAILTLPDDLLNLIFEYLPLDQWNVQYVCSKWNNFYSNPSSTFWKTHFEKLTSLKNLKINYRDAILYSGLLWGNLIEKYYEKNDQYYIRLLIPPSLKTTSYKKFFNFSTKASDILFIGSAFNFTDLKSLFVKIYNDYTLYPYLFCDISKVIDGLFLYKKWIKDILPVLKQHSHKIGLKTYVDRSVDFIQKYTNGIDVIPSDDILLSLHYKVLLYAERFINLNFFELLQKRYKKIKPTSNAISFEMDFDRALTIYSAKKSDFNMIYLNKFIKCFEEFVKKFDENTCDQYLNTFFNFMKDINSGKKITDLVVDSILHFFMLNTRDFHIFCFNHGVEYYYHKME